MAAFAIVACEAEFVPHLDFPPTEVTIPAAGTENADEPLTLKFNANAAWTAAVKGDASVLEWFSISPKSGEAGDAVINLIATANTTKENRVATIEITVEGLQPTLVTVTQLQKNAIDVTAESAYTLSFEGQAVEIEVGHNVDYTYDVTDAAGAAVAWLVETKAYTTDKLVFTAPAQEINAVERTAYVTVYSELGVVKTIKVTQEAWSPIKWTNSLSEVGATAGRVGIAASGDKVYFTANGELFSCDEATGANVEKITLPDGFVAGSVMADDAGNVLVSGPDAAYANSDQLQLYKVSATGYELLIDYAAANYDSTEMGNFRVNGDVNGNAVITAYVCFGGGAAIVWEVTGGVVAAPQYVDLGDGSWDASTGVVAPAGAAVADGLFAVTYGEPWAYNLYYYNGTEWAMTWESPAEWMENFNCISTTEVNGVKYLALTMSCHFNYDMTDLVILDVTNPAAAVKKFSIQVKSHTMDEAGLTYSDVFIKAEGSDLAAYVVDPWMDTVDKYLFPLE